MNYLFFNIFYISKNKTSTAKINVKTNFKKILFNSIPRNSSLKYFPPLNYDKLD